MVEIVTWPESQMVTEYSGYLENAVLINSDKGLDEYGSSAYIVDADWWAKCLNGEIPLRGAEEDDTTEDDELMIDVGFDPDTFDPQTYDMSLFW